MIPRVRVFSRRNRWQDKRQRQLVAMLANMRTAKARKRMENPPEHEPKFLPWYPLELGIRDKVSGETCWIDLKSCRDAAKRIAVILKFYTPGLCRHHQPNDLLP
jgi:hypothetical protein